MTTLTLAQLEDYAQQAGLSPQQSAIAASIAKAESGGRTDAMGDVGLQDKTWGPSVGLWQVRSVKAQSGTGQSRDASKLTDPLFNAKSMVSISGGGKNWGAWTMFTNGGYKKFLADANAVVGSSRGSANFDSLTQSGGGASSVDTAAQQIFWGEDRFKNWLKDYTPGPVKEITQIGNLVEYFFAHLGELSIRSIEVVVGIQLMTFSGGLMAMALAMAGYDAVPQDVKRAGGIVTTVVPELSIAKGLKGAATARSAANAGKAARGAKSASKAKSASNAGKNVSRGAKRTSTVKRAEETFD